MRTLKKTLSLVLVVAMVLGLCVVGASAKNAVDDYKDADQIGDAYYEAVGVMTGIGVIKGMGDGILSPTGNYTRAQAAKIITYMLIGEKAAESLVCTTAPFEDVAANHWAAGYIAFCVEQGIINGMSATTFEPEGQLTGFQWAKMLLCAVGFGAKGEFVGSSWSLNTAKVAHSVGLFDGDLAGADHVALQRQQAILYAFNVLTSVKCVVYSEALGDYIYKYGDFADRYTYEGTLGWNIYKLNSVEGIITDNEGVGAAATTVLPLAGGEVVIAANTGLDLMWHAARVWYVDGKTNTGVFALDLASATDSSCGDMAKIPASYVAKTIGKSTDTAYERSLVDNPDGFPDYAVTFNYRLDTMGTSSEVNKTTNIGSVAVANSTIKTDISNIKLRDTIIVLEATSVAGTKAWYVYAPTATSGAVKSITSTNVITLTDGTVLNPSALGTTDADRINAIARIRAVLVGQNHVTPTYYFTLDTHGHYITMTEDPFRTVAYFTGVTKLSSSHDAWSNSVQFAAQFVDVKTGDIEVIPVTNTWANRVMASIDTEGRSRFNGYFDITDELFGDATYNPRRVTSLNNYYGGTYAIVNDTTVVDTTVTTRAASYPFSAGDTTNTINVPDVNNGAVRFNPSTVTFIIANGAGDSLTVDTYVGVEALLAGYSAKTNMPITTVTLTNMALVVAEEAAGNMSASVIFAYDEALASGGVVFFPKDVETWSVVADDYVAYTVAYLNGASSTQPIVVARPLNTPTGNDIERGFYNYTINEDGYFSITRIPTQRFIYANKAMNSANGVYWINGDRVASDCVVVDTRTGAGTTVDSVTELAALAERTTNVAVAYMLNSNNQVSLIYVVDWNLGFVDDFSFDSSFSPDWTVSPTKAYEDDEVTISSDALKALLPGTDVKVSYKLNGVAANKTVLATVSSQNTLIIDVDEFTGNGFELADVTITDVTYDVTVTNKATTFTKTWWKTPVTSDTQPTVYEEKAEIKDVPVGQAIALCFYDANVANGTVATVVLTGAEDQNVKFGDGGHAWTPAFIAETNDVVVEGVTATYRYVLKTGDPVQTQFSIDKVTGSQVAAQDEVTLIGVVPGQATTLYLKHSGTPAGRPADVAYVSFGGVVNQSVNSVVTATTAATATYGLNVFCFNKVNPKTVSVVEGVNVVEVTWSTWDTQTEGI